ncbi:MAG: DinB superfamily protein [Chloroflexi bacterium]|nr:MAG: DinB superfamily protein [Chloroflexota bacterium]
MAGAAESWGDPADGGEWTVRGTAEHALQTDLYFSRAIADVIGVEAPAERTLTLESAEAAATALREVESDVMAVLNQISDADLEKPSPVLGQMYATVVLVAHHLNMHALQIAER